MTKSIFTLISILLLGSIVSCSTFTTTIPASTPNVTATFESKYSWWTKWLDEPTCKSPCWMNITPGKTSVDEALTILERMPGVVITYKDKGGIDWRFHQNRTDSGVVYSSEGGKVSVIRLGNSSDEKLYFERVIASYGYPSYVELYDCRAAMCSTVLVYPNIGLLVDVFLKDTGGGKSNRVDVQPDVVVTGVYFFQPGLENFLSWPDFQGYNLLRWKGYSKYP